MRANTAWAPSKPGIFGPVRVGVQPSGSVTRRAPAETTAPGEGAPARGGGVPVLRGGRQRPGRAEQGGEQRQAEEQQRSRRTAADRRADVAEGAHPELSKPPGAGLVEAGPEDGLLGRIERRLRPRLGERAWDARGRGRRRRGRLRGGGGRRREARRRDVVGGLRRRRGGGGLRAGPLARRVRGCGCRRRGPRSAERTRSAGAGGERRAEPARSRPRAGAERAAADGAGLLHARDDGVAEPQAQHGRREERPTSIGWAAAAVTASGTARAWTCPGIRQRSLRSGAERARMTKLAYLPMRPALSDADLQDGAGRQEALEGAQPRGSARQRDRAHGAARAHAARRDVRGARRVDRQQRDAHATVLEVAADAHDRERAQQRRARASARSTIGATGSVKLVPSRASRLGRRDRAAGSGGRAARSGSRRSASEWASASTRAPPRRSSPTAR